MQYPRQYQKAKRNCKTQNSICCDGRNDQKDISCYEAFIAFDETFKDSANCRGNMKTGDIKMTIHNIVFKESSNDIFIENSRHLAGIEKIKQTISIENSIGRKPRKRIKCNIIVRAYPGTKINDKSDDPTASILLSDNVEQVI